MDCSDWLVSTHSRLKAAGCPRSSGCGQAAVSTHSRLKAAGKNMPQEKRFEPSFNTQPPEGGWQFKLSACLIPKCFNTQPPEGGWNPRYARMAKVASFNTQPPEGGWLSSCAHRHRRIQVSTHSRLKAAGRAWMMIFVQNLSFNTQPPEGGWSNISQNAGTSSE